MSAELLRKAARLMRERAEAAVPGPWRVGQYGIGSDILFEVDATDEIGENNLGAFNGEDDARHVASWNPTVALAVDHLLNQIASDEPFLPSQVNDAALDVARAYLTTSTTDPRRTA